VSEPKVIVFTGGPCGGKSTIMPIAKQWLENHGYMVAVLVEAATEVISGGFAPFSPLWNPDPLEFQNHLLNYQMSREDSYKRMLRSLRADKTVLLCDRGVLDAMAFIGREEYLKLLWMNAIPLPSLRDRYTAVVHLMSTARGAEEFYTLANNAARSESPEQAAELDKRIEAAWLGHPHFFMADNQSTFHEKVQRVLASLARVLHVPEPTEIERKFLVFDYNIPTDDFVVVEIEQNYLVPIAMEPERRVRKRTLDGASSYFYTSKVMTDDPRVRLERERQIDLGEYERLLREANPRYAPIKKSRTCFTYSGKLFELDIFFEIEGLDGSALKLLEVELTHANEYVELPPEWKVEEVTGKKEYSNAQLAQRRVYIK
jgi:CYTH domain-containing protein/thymidylate kinase